MKRRGRSSTSVIDFFVGILVIIIILNLLYAFFMEGNTDIIGYLLSHITFFELVIEFPLGITIIVVFTAGGIFTRVKMSGR